MENLMEEGSVKTQKEKEEINIIQTTKLYDKDKILDDLDKYIQECLDKYKPKENPDSSLYANTSEEEKDLIISRKSTIPDLVI